MNELENRLRAILRECPMLMAAMAVARDLDLPDWLIFSGAIYQPVWNHLTGRPLEWGLHDIDLGYFDGADLSWAAEDAVIRRIAGASPASVREQVEVRNQARVHLWFEDHFGEPYAPLASAAEALTRFVAPAFAVGARIEAQGEMTLVAPFGLEDLFAMRIRPNPGRVSKAFAAMAEKARARWPEVTVEGQGRGNVPVRPRTAGDEQAESGITRDLRSLVPLAHQWLYRTES
jgi:hypothetical protein